jgi:hypothetical protein
MREAGSAFGWRSLARRSTLLLAAALLALIPVSAGCGGSDTRLAARVLQEHRRRAGVHPLPGSQRILLTLSSPGSPASGTETIEWDGRNYRETVSSAGFRTVRGIQGGKAYFTDEDGVTRVVSEPVLAELVTRSYFWRRAYLFDDAERAKLALGPSRPEELSIQLTPLGGNALVLTFARRGLALTTARSAGLELDFAAPTRWHDASWPAHPVDVELRHAGLPTGALEDASIGGWTSVWASPASESPLLPAPSGTVAVKGNLAGRDVVLAIDAEAEGPVRIRRGTEGTLPLPWTTDVFGRRLARGARLVVGTVQQPSVCVEASDELPPGAEASVGAAVFRESVVEYDRQRSRVVLHDPERWVRPEGYYRAVLDDDGDRPMAILHRAKEVLRLRAGAAGAPAIRVAPEAASRIGIEGSQASGLRWGPAPMPPLDFVRVPAAFQTSRGDDGRLSSDVLLRFQAILDMPHRWAYLKPETGSPAAAER